MANLITLGRLLLALMLVVMVYEAAPGWQIIDAPLLLVVIALDGLDGYVARRRGETSRFGAILDIAIDRAVEYILWIVFADLGLVPVWVALVFVVRGTLVDAIRYGGVLQGESPFGMMRSPLGRQLVAGRFMRAFYGTLKALTFAWILVLQPLPELAPATWASLGGLAGDLTHGLVIACVVVCLVRGLPVIAEFAVSQEALGSRRRRSGPRS